MVAGHYVSKDGEGLGTNSTTIPASLLWGQVNFDLDLATESGAVRFMEVTEEVKQTCREFMPGLEVPIHDP